MLEEWNASHVPIEKQKTQKNLLFVDSHVRTVGIQEFIVPMIHQVYVTPVRFCTQNADTAEYLYLTNQNASAFKWWVVHRVLIICFPKI